MEAELRQKIDEILGPMYCPEDYSCASDGVELLRKAGTDDQGTFPVCLQADPSVCALAVQRGDGYECRCMLRADLSEKLH